MMVIVEVNVGLGWPTAVAKNSDKIDWNRAVFSMILIAIG
jgi:hypothetical protein